MKRLSKAQEAERARLVAALNAADDAVETAVNFFNQQVEEFWPAVEAAVERYNEAVANANEFREGIHGDAESYYDEKSERWQEGEAGEAYSEFKDAWAEEFAELDVDKPDELELPDREAAEQLEEKPGEPG